MPKADPTDKDVDEACMTYRHDFGLMSISDANKLRNEARLWFKAWMKLLEDPRNP